MFFSVKSPMKIAGKVYIPCICYEVTKSLELTINKLVSEDKAVLYTERVFFQNGRVIEKEKTAKKSKKAKKEEVVAEVKSEAELEPVVDMTEEEIKDDF